MLAPRIRSKEPTPQLDHGRQVELEPAESVIVEASQRVVKPAPSSITVPVGVAAKHSRTHASMTTERSTAARAEHGSGASRGVFTGTEGPRFNRSASSTAWLSRNNDRALRASCDRARSDASAVACARDSGTPRTTQLGDSVVAREIIERGTRLTGTAARSPVADV